MADRLRQMPDDPSSAPESGTHDDTSGNQPAHGGERGLEKKAAKPGSGKSQKDDPSEAGEER